MNKKGMLPLIAIIALIVIVIAIFAVFKGKGSSDELAFLVPPEICTKTECRPNSCGGTNVGADQYGCPVYKRQGNDELCAKCESCFDSNTNSYCINKVGCPNGYKSICSVTCGGGQGCDYGETSQTVCQDTFFYDSFCPGCFNDQRPNFKAIDEYYCSMLAKGFECTDYVVPDSQSGVYTVQGYLICCVDSGNPPKLGTYGAIRDHQCDTVDVVDDPTTISPIPDAEGGATETGNDQASTESSDNSGDTSEIDQTDNSDSDSSNDHQDTASDSGSDSASNSGSETSKGFFARLWSWLKTFF